ncbi:MAG: hypothetical protein JXA67_21625 [Micromonosporaceae bacterium]|nr:hypothetical protein [Micromonosporaceae bacterium]
MEPARPAPELGDQPIRLWATARLRVRPAPLLDPPFDDEGQRGQITMDMLPLPTPMTASAPPQGPRPVSRRPEGRRDTGRAVEGYARTPEQDGGCTGRAAARRFASLCVEVINGFRPVTHLRQLTLPQRLADVTGQLLRSTRCYRGRGRTQPMVRIRRIRVCEPTRDVVEAAIVLDCRGACWAMVIRLERSHQGWQCSVLQIVGGGSRASAAGPRRSPRGPSPGARP